MASWLIRIVPSPGKSSRRRREICRGLHALAQRRCCRRPWRRPFQVTAGPAAAAPPGAAMAPANRSRTYARRAEFVASFAGFGRRAARSACHWAVVARYSRPPPRVAALRRSSRETVDAARPSRRATSRTPWPCARHSATSSRSANDRYRPEGGFDDRASVDGGMPPASRNHRAPTAGDTPAPSAASSLDCPAAIAAQNRRRSSRRATPGRPGERDTPRPDRSERRLRVPIANPSTEVLRRPLESALDPSVTVMDQAGFRPAALQGHDQRVHAQPGPQVIRHRPADDLARGQVLDRGQVQPALVRRQVGDVGQPDRVGPLGDEVAVEQVRGDRQVVPAVGGPRGPTAAPPRLPAHPAHPPPAPTAPAPPSPPPAGVPPPRPARRGVPPPRAVGPPPGGEDAADQAAQLGLRLGPGADGRDRAQPGVEAADARADDAAQRGDGVVRPLGGDEREPAHAIPRAKKAAAFLRISTSSSSRLFSRLSRCSSACSALRAANASAEPAARCSLRHALSWPGLSPSSVATSPSPLPPSSSRLTASALNSVVNRRRFCLSAILPS